MDSLPPLPSLGETLRQFGLAPRRSLGQNFILDPHLTQRIAEAAGDLAGVHAIEIGPGPGGLTRALLATGAAGVTAIERDPRCLAALEQLALRHPDRLKLVAGDALALDPAALVPAPRQIVANLPYNIATTLLIQWLGQIQAYRRLTLMFQKEVALRLVAPPDTEHYGRLSVLTQWLAQPSVEFHLPPGAFVPPPKVTSTVVSIVPRPAPLAPACRADLERVTAAAFGQRRKMLRQSLKTLGPKTLGPKTLGPKTLDIDTLALIEAAGLDPTARAETLPVEAFCALAREYARLKAPETSPR